MITRDAVLTGVWTQLDSHTGLRSILGATGRIVKGLKRPDGLPNPCITIHQSQAIYPGGDWFGSNGLRRVIDVPVWLNVYADNEANGAWDVPTLSTICANVNSIQADAKPTITGATVHRLGVLNEAGPLYDTMDPHEAYMVMQLGFWLSDTQ